MRLKTKLVLLATGLTFAIVLVLSMVFLTELLRQRVAQTAASNDVLAHEVLLMTRQSLVVGLRAHPPADGSDESLHAAVTDALRSSESLTEVMNAIVRYSPTVEEVSVTDAHGMTLVSTDPDSLNQQAPFRTAFSQVSDGSVSYQARQVFGQPRVLDVATPLDRNGMPFLVVHVGVRSSFLKNSYAPWLRAALLVALVAALGTMGVAGVLANLALRPLETVSARLERLTLSPGYGTSTEGAPLLLESHRADAVVRVAKTIERLDRKIRTTEEGYTALQTNLNQMLDTLRDGVVLVTADGRAAMVSDAVAHFVGGPQVSDRSTVGLRLEEIFKRRTALGAAVLEGFASGREISGQLVQLEDGRRVQISLDPIDDGRGSRRQMGTLLTLRDVDTAVQLEQELEVSRRLAAIGRLTSGVGHEVKNPINAMVVHLELLRSKLAGGQMDGAGLEGAGRHVEILASEMQRLDRVVQTLADFSRPMELHLAEVDLKRIIANVVELMDAEMAEQGVEVELELPGESVPVRVDGELMRQALLNLLLNGMQAMPGGGRMRVGLRREFGNAVVEIADEGVGIPADVLPRIFDLYFTTKPKGSGIGLAMTYRILQMHGGALEVRSVADPGSSDRGTTFTLRLPISAGSQRVPAGQMEMEERV